MKLFKLLSITALVLLTIISCGPAAGVKEEKPLIVETPENAPVIIEENIDANREMIDGFKVKVDSRATIEEAKVLEKEIATKVDEPIYTDLVVDQYMVYVGDCQTKEEGEELKKTLRLNGFSKSYLVPKKVYKKIDAAISVENLTVEDKSAVAQTTEAFAAKEEHLGFRIQVFAGKSKENAEKLRRDLASVVKDKIYLVVSNDMYKLQVGDFKSKPSAEITRDVLRTNKSFNLSGAFIVDGVIYRDKVVAGSSADKFFIQVGAFSSNDGALRIKETAVGMGFNAIVLEEEGLFKVMVGGYPDREAAEKAKSSLVDSGFDGAWILEK